MDAPTEFVNFAAACTPQKTLCARRSVAGWPAARQGAQRSETFILQKGSALLKNTVMGAAYMPRP